MCGLPSVIGGGGIKGLARAGMFGLSGLALAGKKKPQPDRQQVLYPNEAG